MSLNAVTSDRAPAAIGPYSQAIRAGNTVYLSGQIPLDPATGELVAGDIEAQAVRVFENLKAVAEAAGGSLRQVVKVTIYLKDMANFPKIVEARKQYFTAPYPADTIVEVSSLALPELQVEIDVVAAA